VSIWQARQRESLLVKREIRISRLPRWCLVQRIATNPRKE